MNPSQETSKNVTPENIDDETKDFLEEAMQETVMVNIFSSCDVSQTGEVAASKLIEFISSYINSVQLDAIRNVLDPDGTNPSINKNTFIAGMKIWIEQVKGNITNSPSPSFDRRLSGVSGIHPLQSSPIGNILETNLQRIDSDMNLSNISCYSCTGNVSSAGLDSVVLQEQINDLQHQNKKLNEAIFEIRSQLNASEEQNNILQADIDRVTKRLQAEQKVNECLQKERRDHDEYRETTENIRKQFDLVNQELNIFKKDNALLKQKISEYETEAQKLQVTILQLQDNVAKKDMKIESLKIEIGLRDKEISALEGDNKLLVEQCRECDEHIRYFIDENQCLKYEKQSLENRLKEAKSRNAQVLLQLNESSNQDNQQEADPQVSPSTVQRLSKSLSLSTLSSIDDDYLWKVAQVKPQTPQESLHSELVNAPQVECDGSLVSCDHKLQLIQCENKLKTLIIEFKQHENCSSLMKRYQDELEECQSLLKELECKNKELEEEMATIKIEGEKKLKTLGNSKEELELDCKSKNEEISNLELNLSKLKKEMEKIMETNKIAEMEWNMLKKNKEAFQSECKTKTEEISNLESELLKLKTEMEKIMQEKKRDEDEIKKLKLSEEALKSECETQSKEISILENHLLKLQTEISLVESTLSNFKIEVEEHNIKQNSKAEKISNLESDLSKLKTEFENTKEQLTKEKSNSLKQCETLNNEIGKLKTQINEKDKEIQHQISWNKNLTEKISLLNEKYNLAQQELVSLKEEYCNIKNILKTSTEDLEKQFEQIQKEKQSLIMENKSLSKEIAKQTENYAKIQQDFANLKTKYQTIQTEWEEKLSIFKNHIEEKDNEKDKLFKELSISKEDYNKTRQELDKLTENYEKLLNDYEITRKEISEIKEQNDSLQVVFEGNELEKTNQLREKFRICQEKYFVLQEDLTTSKEENSNLKSTLLDLQQKYVEDLTKNKEENIKLKSSLTNLQKKYEINKQKIFNQKLELRKLDELIVANADLQCRLEDQNQKYNKAQKQLDEFSDLRSQYTSLQTQLVEKDANIINITMQLKERDANIVEITIQLKEKTVRINNLEANYEKEKTNWSKQEKELKEKINVLEQAISSTHRQSSTCQNCEMLNAELVDLRMSSNIMKTKLKEIETENNKSKSAIDVKKTTRVEVLNHVIEKLEQQLFEEKERTKISFLNLRTMEAEKNELEIKLQEAIKEKEELINQKDSSQSKVKKLSHNVEGLELKLQVNRQSISDLTEDLTSKNTEVLSLINKLSLTEGKYLQLDRNYKKLVDHVNETKLKMREIRQTLSGHTLYAVSSWKTAIENINPDLPILKLLKGKLGQNSGEYVQPLDEELYLLTHQNQMTSELLKTLTKVKENTSGTSDSGDCTPTHSPYFNRSRTNESLLATVVRKKFTLKPATLILDETAPESSYQNSHQNSRQNILQTSPMSPDSPAAMTEGESLSSKILFSSSEIELNNNEFSGDLTTGTQVNDIDSNSQSQNISERRSFLSNGSDSGSSSDTNSSDSVSVKLTLRQENDPRLSAGSSKKNEESVNSVKEGLARQFRSMSEGAVVTHELTPDGDVTVFPNLRDSVLENMGLLPDEPRERLSEEEIETKFQTLSLAFAIDAVTLVDRMERQRQQRNQAEDNIRAEVTRLAEAIGRLHPLCVDAETTELVTGLLAQLDVIIQASSRISTSAEVFGSVQQEWRLAESVNLMLSHLRNLRQQRDTSRRQLQCTKRMLQQCSGPVESASVSVRARTGSSGAVAGVGGGRGMTRRRASISTLPQTGAAGGATATGSGGGGSGGMCGACSVRVRRPSHTVTESRHRHDDKANTLLRSARPSRLELVLDLVKIQEGQVENSTTNNNSNDKTESDELNSTCSDSLFSTPTDTNDNNSFTRETEIQPPNTIWRRFVHIIRQIGAFILGYWDHLLRDGTFHEFCILGALVSFVICVIILGHIFIENRLRTDQSNIRNIPWQWVTWDEIFDQFVEIRRLGPPPV